MFWVGDKNDLRRLFITTLNEARFLGEFLREFISGYPGVTLFKML
tara:strand:- start:6995 stop:7129 length:135 start_codon:yes stop_codon:yes gene_type:complete